MTVDQHIRTVDGRHQTAVFRYVHLETGSRTSLSGVRHYAEHYAEPTYWYSGLFVTRIVRMLRISDRRLCLAQSWAFG